MKSKRNLELKNQEKFFYLATMLRVVALSDALVHRGVNKPIDKLYPSTSSGYVLAAPELVEGGFEGGLKGKMIREYEAKDLSQLLDAWYSASQVGHPFLDEGFFEQERRKIAALYLPNAETWVYELDGVVVGFIALIGNEVGAIFVEARFHGQGIGRALMDKARSIRDGLELDVFKDNLVGRKFYEKCGFSQVDEHLHEETGFMLLRLKLGRLQENM